MFEKLVLSAAYIFLGLANVVYGTSGKHIPTIDELLTIKTVDRVQISPDGRWVAYTVEDSDLKQDAFVTQIWVADASAGKIFQVTHSDKSSTNPKWSPDGQWLTFLSNRLEDRNQIFLIRPNGGEAVRLTNSETPISNFAWSEHGATIAYLATEPVSQVSKDRKEYFGDYQVVRKDYNYNHIWTLNVNEALTAPVVGNQRTKNHDFSVDSFSWSPDGSQIAFSATSYRKAVSLAESNGDPNIESFRRKVARVSGLLK